MAKGDCRTKFLAGKLKLSSYNHVIFLLLVKHQQMWFDAPELIAVHSLLYAKTFLLIVILRRNFFIDLPHLQIARI